MTLDDVKQLPTLREGAVKDYGSYTTSEMGVCNILVEAYSVAEPEIELRGVETKL